MKQPRCIPPRLSGEAEPAAVLEAELDPAPQQRDVRIRLID